MTKIINYLIYLLVTFTCIYPITSNAAKKECVILLHGITRNHSSMSKLESALKQYDYLVVNDDYPSTKKSIAAIANENITPMLDKCLKKDVNKIHFVTHSMGGLVLQQYLHNHQIAKLGRIVMMSPPNHGSEVADLLVHNWLYGFITGPAGQELTTDKNSTPNHFHLKPKYQIGVIAGTFNLIPFENFIFHDQNDGAVSVSSAKTNIMQDFIALPVTHMFMMDNPLTQFEILNFLKFGLFKSIMYVKSV